MFNCSVHRAVQDNNIEQLKLLIKSGCDVNVIENDETPLQVAIERKCDVDIVKLLLNHGAVIRWEKTLYYILNRFRNRIKNK